MGGGMLYSSSVHIWGGGYVVMPPWAVQGGRPPPGIFEQRLKVDVLKKWAFPPSAKFNAIEFQIYTLLFFFNFKSPPYSFSVQCFLGADPFVKRWEQDVKNGKRFLEFRRNMAIQIFIKSKSSEMYSGICPWRAQIFFCLFRAYIAPLGPIPGNHRFHRSKGGWSELI